MPVAILIVLLIVLLLVGFFALMIAGESSDDENGATIILIMCVFLFFGGLIWLVIASSQNYSIIGQRNYTIRTVTDHKAIDQFIDTSHGVVDVNLTFGQTFPEHTVVQETEIDPTVGGLKFDVDSPYLYEVVNIPNATH